jgi:hypothetical protein
MADKLITPEFRGSFVHLTKPVKMKGMDESEPRYQILIPLDKDDPFWDDLEDAIEEALEDKFGKIPKKFKHPVKDGDDEEYDNLKGMSFINATNSRRPGVVDENLDPIMEADELYSGAWYRASINVWAWSHPTGGNGVSISLNNVMKIRDDERYDGGTNAETDFAGFAKKGGQKTRSRRSRDDDDEDDRSSRRGRSSRDEEEEEERPSRRSRR